MPSDTITSATAVNIWEIAKEYEEQLLNFFYANFCELDRKKKRRVSLGAPYASFVAALGQNESAELSFLW